MIVSGHIKKIQWLVKTVLRNCTRSVVLPGKKVKKLIRSQNCSY